MKLCAAVGLGTADRASPFGCRPQASLPTPTGNNNNNIVLTIKLVIYYVSSSLHLILNPCVRYMFGI